MTHRMPLALLALPVVLLLGACGPGTPDPDGGETPTGTEPSTTPTSVEVPAPQLPDDALLVVSASIQASNGATMRVDSIVRKATAWDDPAAPERPAQMSTECAGYLDESVYGLYLWSFATVDVTATPSNDIPWPDGEGVWVFPDSDYVAQAETGVLGEDDGTASDVPHCFRQKRITSAGSGTIVAGFAGDTDAVGAAGHFTHWANHNYGYSSYSNEMVISDCTYEATPLGYEFGWSDDHETVVEADLCRIGRFDEDVEY